MNRTGLFIALAVAVVVGALFCIYAQFDLDLSGLFFNPDTHRFRVYGQHWEQHARDASRWLIILLVAPGFLALGGKLIFPRRRMLIGGRSALLLVLTLALGPGLLANTLLKDHWGRSRPIDVIEFGGADPFTPWWNPGGPCPNNCSFIAGEPSGAFWTLAPATMAPPQWRLLAYGGAIAFGIALGVLRIAAGGHFFTDVAFAGVFMYLVVWSTYGFIFRWRTTRLGEDSVERAFGRAGEAIRRSFAAIMGRPSQSPD
jgi:lipid A 4'-phosphatase